MDFSIDEGPILEAVDRLEGKSGGLEEQEAVEILGGLISQVQSSLGGAEAAGRLDLVEMLCRRAEQAYLGAAAWVDAKTAESYALASTYWSVKADHAGLERSLAPRNPVSLKEFYASEQETPTQRGVSSREVDPTSTRRAKFSLQQTGRYGSSGKTRSGISFTKGEEKRSPSVTPRGQETPPSPEEVLERLQRKAAESDKFKDAVAKKLLYRGGGGFSNTA